MAPHSSRRIYQRIWIVSVIVCSVIMVKGVIERPYSADLTTVVREGQRQYELIKEKTNLPDSGQCWKNAVAHLHHGCKHLTEILQVELALRFADCFLQSSGHSGISCLVNNEDTSNINPQDCLRNLTDRVFLTYTEFYTHSQSMCLFLMSQVWHQETQKTIDKLWSSASDVSKRLEESGKLQETLLDGQKESMNLQQTLLDRSHQLGNLVHDSASTLAVVFKEFRSTASEQQQLLGQVFHHLSALQSWIVGEVSWVDSLVFYVCAIFITYLVTSPRRVADARFPLFVVLLSSAAAERVLASYILAENNDPETVVLIGTLKEQLYWWLWILRRTTLGISGLVLTVMFFKYADQEQQRHQLLLQIWSQNKEMITYLQNKLANQGDVPDSIGYTAIKVNLENPTTPNGKIQEAARIAVNGTPTSPRSPGQRIFGYPNGGATPTLESALSRCPSPPSEPPSNGSVLNTKVPSRTSSSDNALRTPSTELRMSSSEDMFHSILEGSAELSFDAGDVATNKPDGKVRTKSPARRRKKSPGRLPVTSVRVTSYNLRRFATPSLA